MSSQSLAAPAWRPRGLLPGLLQDRLFRNGGLLTLSSLITSGVGLAYWAVATHSYGADVVGRNTAAISAMMFLSGLAQLNLMSALVRFIPIAGSSTRSLVVKSYAACAVTAVVLAVGFLLAVGRLAPGLRFLTASPAMAVGFIGSTVAWGIFVLQDSVLTGLRRTWLVPAENAVYATAKLVLVVALAALLPATGILVSWTAALVVSLVPVNGFIFRRAIPRQERDGSVGITGVTPVVRFAAGDLGGAVAWLAAVNLLPLLVLQMAGSRANAFYAVAWVIAYSLYLVSGNMGVSLVVETASGETPPAVQCKRLVSHSLKVLVPVTAILIVGAPWLLRVFGSAYSSEGTMTLRLLLLSAIPNVVTATAVSGLRAARRTGTGTALLVVLAAMVFGFTALLLPAMGIVGVGVAWLLAQTITAAAVVAVTALRTRRPRPGPGSAVGSPALEQALQQAASRLVGSQLLPHALTVARELKSYSDLRVAVISPVGAGPVAVLKVAVSPAAASDLTAGIGRVDDLAADEQLGDWRDLLPVPVLSDIDPGGGWLVERWIAGVEGRAFDWREPRTADAVLRSAAAAIRPLHERSARPVTPGRAWLDEWVSGPIAVTAGIYRPGSGWRRCLNGLEGLLEAELAGRPTRTGWVHGDYTPGNLILDPDGSRVRGIVDWGGAAPDGPSYIDTGILVLSTRMLRTRKELGAVLIDLLRRPELTDVEADLIRCDDTQPSLRVQLMMCWLRHVAGNLTKASYYGNHFLWRSRNVDAVLCEVGEW